MESERRGGCTPGSGGEQVTDEERTIQVELQPSGLEAIELYRKRMLELIGVKLTESQVAAMLIHFGKQVQMGPAHAGLLAPPADPVPPLSPRKRDIAARAKSARCACGCGGKVGPKARWKLGHHKRGAASTRGSDEPKAEVVWDGRGSLTRYSDDE